MARTALTHIRRTWAVIALLACLVTIPACQDTPDDGLVHVTIKGKAFRLEPALDGPTRGLGLGERRELAADGGMIFVFKKAASQAFVMRDCYIDIDIAFLDDSGRIVAIHAMKTEAPQHEGESERTYALRLTQYPSRFPASVAVEVLGGTFADLGLKEGEVIKVDVEGLKARAE